MSTLQEDRGSPPPPVAATPQRPDGLVRPGWLTAASSTVRPWAQRRRWALATVLTTLLGGLVPLFWDPRYYFRGDTQVGAFPQWVHLGRLALAGQWPLIDLQAWRAGNFVAEGQWGLFSPLIIGIGVLAAGAGHAVPFVTVLKLGFLVTAALGTYLLVRSYEAAAPWAYLAGVAVTLGGITAFLDSPSWVTGLFVWALLPVAWWLTRRTMRHGANPLPAIAVGWLIVTVGYVYGTIYLALVILACLLDCAVARDRAAAVRVLVIGVCAGLVAVPVYLPGILTASVTIRGSWAVVDNGRLAVEIPGLLASMLPTVQPPSSVGSPSHYVAWFLPVLLWLDRRRVRAIARPLAGLAFLLVATLAWALGPNEIGPIRWPLRIMPVVVLLVLVLLAVLLSHARRTTVSVTRLAVTLGTVGIAAYLVAARHWDLLGQVTVSVVVTVVGLVVSWLLLGRGPVSTRGRRERAAVASMAGWCLLVAVVQHGYYPVSASPDRNMPSRTADYASAASTARGDMMLVGDPEHAVFLSPDVARDFLVGSSWYVGPVSTQSVYTTIGYTAFNDRYCVLYNGSTCPGALGILLSREPTTKKLRVDLLSVSTLQLFRPNFKDSRLLDPPAGWSVTHTSPSAVTWVRDDPEPTAGGVVFASKGLRWTQRESTARDLTVEIGRVPAAGGTLVLSRLAWPGYAVTGAELAPSTDGYLLTLRVPPGAGPRTVHLHYDPPGWAVEKTALVAGVLLGLGWSVGEVVLGWRRRRVRHRLGQPAS